MAEAVWVPIAGYDDLYQVSECGMVRNNKRALCPSTHRDGYIKVNLYRDGASKTFMVHRLVAESFLGVPLKECLQVNHIDGNKSNNHVLNLEWVTATANVQHAVKTRLFTQMGEGQHLAKITNAAVVAIRKARQSGVSLKELAAEHGVSLSTISAVASGRTWKHV